MIVRPQAGPSVVPGAGVESGAMERIDHRALIHGNGDVQRPLKSTLAADPEIGLAIDAEASGGTAALGLLRPDFHDQRVAEWRQRLGVERLRPGIVGHRKADVVDHAETPHTTLGAARQHASWAPLPGNAPAQTCRSTIFFLISAMALAGLRCFGQAFEQFRMVWQR